MLRISKTECISSAFAKYIKRIQPDELETITPFNQLILPTEETIEQIEQFLAEHGGEPVKRIGTLVSRTICHNPADGSGSHKLYYYDHHQYYPNC